MNEYFEKKRQEYRMKKEALNYCCLCIHLNHKPEDVELYRRGLVKLLKLKNPLN